MFAWILKTKPEKASAAGSIGPRSLPRAVGGEASSTSASRNGSTPKLLSALPKKTGVCRPDAERVDVELPQRAQQLDLFQEQPVLVLAEQAPQLRIPHVGHVQRRLALSARDLLEPQGLRGAPVEHAAEVAARPHRAVEGHGHHAQDLLDLVEQVERVAGRQVELVHERQDRQPALPAHLEQLAGLRLDALAGVEHHDGAVHRGQDAVGVLAEVLVARRVEQVEAAAVVLELQHGRGHGDAARLLHLQPVGPRMALLRLAPDRAGEVDGARVQEQLLRERRLARVGVGDDREGPTPIGFASDLGVQDGRGAAR